MDIRSVESIATSGGLKDTSYRIDGSLENVSLDWDGVSGALSVVDYNIDYSILPWQLYTDVVKKTFLTYNGQSCGAGELLETVVMQSSSEDDVNQIPGYNNSSQWSFVPRTFHYPTELRAFTNVDEFYTKPYDRAAGYTVVKTFLTAGANISPGDPMYQSYHTGPTQTSFVPPNVEGNKLYTDGWYTSYVSLVRTWASVDPVINGSAKDVILYYAPQKEFYINITGVGGTVVTDPTNTLLTMPDSVNWRKAPSFAEWKELMRNNVGTVMVNDPIFFIETQHLATPEMAILAELKKQCACCDQPKFNISGLKDYMKLIQKRLGAWAEFNAGLYHEAACILEQARKTCYQCLYHTDECNETPKGRC